MIQQSLFQVFTEEARKYMPAKKHAQEYSEQFNHNSLALKTGQLAFTRRRMDQQSIHAQEILLSNKKEWNTDNLT